MRRFFTGSATACAALWIAALIAQGASAQNLNFARVDIPFDFVANHQALPAGCYRIQLQSDAILTLADCTTGKKVGVMVHTANGYPAVHGGSMVFRATALGHRLLHVRFGATDLQSELSVQQSPREREWASIGANQTVTVGMY